MGGQGVYLQGSRGDLEGAIDSGLYLCTSCGQCLEVCPSRIDTKKGIIVARSDAFERGKGLSAERKAVSASVANYDNPWQVPRKKKSKWAEGLGLKKKGKTLYFAGCSTSLLFPESGRRAVRVLRALGLEPAYLGDSESCCGATVRKLGDEDLARKKAEACFRDFSEAGAKTVVTSCSGCSSALNHYEDLAEKHGIKVEHITQFLSGNLGAAKLRKTAIKGGVTFHDPCDLGRDQGVYDEPRAVLAEVLSTPIIEMERSRNMSACCGSGSGVKTVYPELAKAIGQDRVAMAKNAGAHTIVTTCPWCEQSLRECQGDAPEVAVVDLLELFEKALVR
jgi:Fe-S oxidoreductase